MKALKCDICGKYFDITNSDNRTIIPNSLEISSIGETGYAYEKTEYDMCPACYAAIKKTIDDRRKQSVDPMEDDLK